MKVKYRTVQYRCMVSLNFMISTFVDIQIATTPTYRYRQTASPYTMPTNKKKGSGSKNKATQSATTDPASKSKKTIAKANNAPRKNPMILKGPQLTALILLSIGLSRVMQVRSAFAVEPDGQPVQICVQHLGEAACTNDIILSLLKYKYGTALQLTILVVSIAIKLWNAPDENDLARFNTLLCVTPLITGIQVLYVWRDTLGSGVLVKQLMMGVVLAILCAPSSLKMLPFYGPSKTGVRTKAVPALVLLSLVVWNLFQTVSYLWMTTGMTTIEPTTTTTTQWWLPVQASALQSLSLELQVAAKPIIYFLAVDCLTTAALCAYCWQVLSYPSQRVSAVSGLEL